MHYADVLVVHNSELLILCIQLQCILSWFNASMIMNVIIVNVMSSKVMFKYYILQVQLFSNYWYYVVEHFKIQCNFYNKLPSSQNN